MQTRRRSKNCGGGANFWQDLIEHVDKRINEFKQKYELMTELRKLDICNLTLQGSERSLQPIEEVER